MARQTKPVDIYTRVSRVAGRETLLSPDEQEEKARAFAEERGLLVGEVLEPDLDQSGTKLVRPSLQLAIQRVRDGKSAGIVVMELSRFARDAAAGKLVEEIERLGGSVYAPDAPSDWTTAGGKLQGNLIFAFAQYVADVARERFEYAKERSIERGVPINTRPAVGYRKRPDRRLEPDPVTAAVVRQVFERRAAGAGPVELAEFLESNGVTTSQGSRTWSKPAIYNLISNRVYLGDISYGKDRDEETGQRRPRFVNRGAHEPLVDIATWQMAQGGPARPRSRRERVWLLSGLLRCEGCRHALQGTTDAHKHPIYRCTRRHAGGICTKPARMRAERIEAAVLADMWAHMPKLRARGRRDATGRVAQLGRAAEKERAALKEWASPRMQAEIGDLDLYVEGMRVRKQRVADAEAALDAEQRLTATAQALPDDVTLRAAWERMSVADRAALLATRYDCLVLRRRPDAIVVFPLGSGPTDLPRQGYRREPTLRPFDINFPDGVRILTL